MGFLLLRLTTPPWWSWGSGPETEVQQAEAGSFKDTHQGETSDPGEAAAQAGQQIQVKIYGDTWCSEAGHEIIKPISEWVWQEVPNQ